MTKRRWIRPTAIIMGPVTILLIAMACGHTATPQQSLEQRPSPNSNQAVNKPNSPLDHDAPQSETSSNKLKCSIAVEEESWSTGKPAHVSIVVENVSGSKIDWTVIPAFVLVLESEEADVDDISYRRNQYWSPVDIKQNRLLDLQQKAHIYLEKSESMRSKIDLTTLRWVRRISAIWPSRDLFTTVSAGRYQLRLDIQDPEPYGYKSVGTSKVPLHRYVLSNTVHVEIK